MSSFTFTDYGRSTPARQGVPASSSRTVHVVVYAPSGPTEALPTVVFAPGWDNQSAAYDPLLRAISGDGYIVVGVDSPGTSNWFPGTPIVSDLTDNALDLDEALGQAEAGPLAGRIDRHEVAVVGHSDGGTEAAGLALDSALPSPFNAYVVLSGDMPYGEIPGSYGPLGRGPIMAMVGTNDEDGNYTPQPGGNGTESVYAAAGPTRLMATIAGGSHLGPYIGSGAQSDDTRSAIVAFLDTVETHRAGSLQSLQSDLSGQGLSAQEDLGPGFGQPSAVGVAAAADGNGYWLAEDSGVVRSFGSAPALGGLPSPVAPAVAMAASPSGHGYWLVDAQGDVYGFGDAASHGDLRGIALDAPIVAMAADPATGGYWLLGADGGVFSFDARFYGSTGGMHLVAPALGMAAAPDGRGYWFAASDGGVFSFGDARFRGSLGGVRLDAPIVAMAADPASWGYWLLGTDGGVFSFDAPFFGSTGTVRLAAPMVSMAASGGGGGYWLVGRDGGVFSFGAARFHGSGL